MGRHTVPGSGTPEPDRGFWVRVAVAAVAAVLVLGFVATRLLGGGGDTSTTDAASPSPSTSVSGVGPSGGSTDGSPPVPATVTSSSSRSGSPSTTSSPSASASPSPSRRPPTLSLRVLSRTYITIRVPGGRTLDSKIFEAGATATYDQRVLEVVNGRPAGVRFLVNGVPHKPGPETRPETFTARRG